ncbi:hypothetical protein DN402_04610 [Streptomyces sp. SW4]|nr:hypothetical protein DN402_04610 [Streptomyces sp. SW4]
MRDTTRNPDRALGEATEIRGGVHPRVASFRRSWVGVHRNVMAGATEVKRRAPPRGDRRERRERAPRTAEMTLRGT